VNRRGFLQSLVGGIAATAAVRIWPFRVYSFPSEIKIADATAIGIELENIPLEKFATIWYSKEAVDLLKKRFQFFAMDETRIDGLIPQRIRFYPHERVAA